MLRTACMLRVNLMEQECLMVTRWKQADGFGLAWALATELPLQTQEALTATDQGLELEAFSQVKWYMCSH